MADSKAQYEIASPYKVTQFFRFVFPSDKIKEHNFVFLNPVVHCQVKITKHPDRANLPFTLDNVIRTAMHCFCFDVKEEYGHCRVLRFQTHLLNHYEGEGQSPQVKGIMFGPPIEFEEDKIAEAVAKLQTENHVFLQTLDESTEVDVIITAVLSGCECPHCVTMWNQAKELYDKEQSLKGGEKSISEMIDDLGNIPDTMEE
jgi:hypothetical protein